VRGFLAAEVPWSTLRKAHDRARTLLGHPFPFSTKRCFTDGRSIFAQASNIGRQGGWTEILTGQAHFDAIVRETFLQLEFGSDGLPTRWWPLVMGHSVLLDPQRGYGRPIVDDGGVPTAVLAAAIAAGDSESRVATWFQVSRASVREAVRFEQLHAA